jgi:RNA polymerase sigma-70 factor (ECF subfamily)
VARRVKKTVKKGARLKQIEQLYRSRYPYFVQVARAVVGDEATAHDVVQDGFSLAIRNRESFRGDGPLEAWIWRAVVNAALSARRRTVSFDPFDADAEPSSVAFTNDEREIRLGIATLPERQRLAVFLRYYADLDYRAIAAALGVEVGTVSATLSAAHAALRRSIVPPEEVPQ